MSLLGKKGKTLDAQAREIALNVAEYFKREADLGKTLLPLHSYQKRAAAATGISTATLRKLEGARREIKSEKVAAEGMVEDPFPDLAITGSSFLDSTDSRHKCKKCLKSRKFFCYTCCTPNPQLQDKLPKVKLPLKIDIIKHQNESDGKSTCPHAVVLAPDDVTVYTFPCIPDYDKEKVVLVFPCKEASSLADLVTYSSMPANNNSTVPTVSVSSPESLTDPVNAMIHNTPTASIATTDSGLHTPRPEQVSTVGNYADIAAGSTFPDLTNIWNNTYYQPSGPNSVTAYSYMQPVAMFQSSQQQQQDFASSTSSGKRMADSENEEGDTKRIRSDRGLPFERAIFIDCTWNQTKTIIQDERLKDLHRVEIHNHQTQFWRCQEGIPTSCLSTIEAIYYFMREFHEEVLGLTYMHEYDNLLFFFVYFYRKIREKYQGVKELKAYQRHRAESGDDVM